jgi:hypothetical protein
MTEEDFEKVWAYFSHDGTSEYRSEEDDRCYVWLSLDRMFKDELKKELMK